MELLRLNRWVLIGTAFSLLVCFGLVEFFNFAKFSDSGWMIAPIILGIIISPILVIWTVGQAIVQSVRCAKKSLQLETVGVSYLSLILCFSGAYYLQAAIGDFNDTISEYHYYESLKHPIYQRDIEAGHDLSRGENEKTFKGMETRLWAGVRDRVIGWSVGAVDPPLEKLLEATRWDIKEVVYLKSDARIDVYVDCLYFSIATMTTLGFGDITPRSMLAKISASVQVLVGVLLAAVGIGLALQVRNEKS